MARRVLDRNRLRRLRNLADQAFINRQKSPINRVFAQPLSGNQLHPVIVCSPVDRANIRDHCPSDQPHDL